MTIIIVEVIKATMQFILFLQLAIDFIIFVMVDLKMATIISLAYKTIQKKNKNSLQWQMDYKMNY